MSETKVITTWIIENYPNMAFLKEPATVVNFLCDGSCGTEIQNYNKGKERCIGCPTPYRKARKVEAIKRKKKGVWGSSMVEVQGQIKFQTNG